MVQNFIKKGWNDGYQECQKLLLIERKYTESEMRKVWNLAIENEILRKKNIPVEKTYEELIQSLNE